MAAPLLVAFAGKLALKELAPHALEWGKKELPGMLTSFKDHLGEQIGAYNRRFGAIQDALTQRLCTEIMGKQRPGSIQPKELKALDDIGHPGSGGVAFS